MRSECSIGTDHQEMQRQADWRAERIVSNKKNDTTKKKEKQPVAHRAERCQKPACSRKWNEDVFHVVCCFIPEALKNMRQVF